MGCGCGKKKSTSKFEVVYANGNKQTFSTESAADAAVRRSGGTATKNKIA